MHTLRGSLVYVMWESSFVINSIPHTKDHKIWPSLVLLSIWFQRGRIVGPKASPTHNNTKIHQFNFFWRDIQLVSSLQLVSGLHSIGAIGVKLSSGFGYGRLKRSKAENPIWEWSEKGRKLDYGVRGKLKSIIPQGDICNSKISYKSSFHSVSFSIIWYLLLFACFGRVVIKHQKGGDCKEHGPLAHVV